MFQLVNHLQLNTADETRIMNDLTKWETNGITYNVMIFFILIFCVCNATFNNISAILWRPALVMEEAGVPGEFSEEVNLITLYRARVAQ
jgi:hypothetical protein